MKKILILTSEKTGSGHHASAKAIEKKLQDKGFETKQIDVFPLMGFMGRLMENSYIPLTTKAPMVYYFCQRVSEFFPWYIHSHMYWWLKDNLLKIIDEYKPDLIISVHCMFTKAISHMIRKNNLNIPFFIGVIDLINPPKVWEDKKADLIFVPTEKIRDSYIRKGFEEDTVVVSGFPVRDDIVKAEQIKNTNGTINILMVNASTDLNKNLSFLDEISKLENVNIDFVCGLDKRMYEVLEQMQNNGELKDNIRIHGFINNVNELLEKSHILLTKAGPNMIMEALHSGTAIIITGHIKGQESHNYTYVTDNGFGLKCEDPKKIYKTVNDFINSGELTNCLTRIHSSRIINGADVIAEFTEKYFDQNNI